MEVVHLTTNLSGGAGKAVFRLHELMRGWGIRSNLVARYGDAKQLDGVFSVSDSYNKVEKAATVLKRKILYRDKYCAYEVNDINYRNFRSFFSMLDLKPDVVLLHWVSGFIGIHDIEWVKSTTGARILWYGLDMAPFTGGCHFAWGCKEYYDGCYLCPAARNVISRTKVQEHFRLKKAIVDQCDIELIVPNKFVESQALGSGLGFAQIHQCYLPIDEKVFDVRKKASIDTDLVILFGAVELKNPRKGFAEFVSVMHGFEKLLGLNNESSRVKILIPGASPEVCRMFSFSCRSIEYAHTDQQLSNIYAMADVFVSTSLEDSGPMMVVESLMCGLPVFSFPVGIANETIENSENGYISPIGDTFDMAKNLFDYTKLSRSQRDMMRYNARNSVIKKMSITEHMRELSKILFETD